MIVSFKDEATGDLYHGRASRKPLRIPADLWAVSRRKLDMLSAASDIRDLFAPPGNRLEKLHGELAGFYSIRINDRYRVIFRWSGNSAHDVEVTDYH